MIHIKLCKFFRKNLWIIVLLTLSASGIILGFWGFDKQHYNFSDNLYEIFRLFFLNISSDELGMSWQLQWAKWLIFAALLWATFRLFFEIIAPQFFKDLKIWAYYRNHIVICGLNKVTINLTEKFRNEKIIVLAENTNKYAESINTKGAKLLIGDLSDEDFLRKAKIDKASQFYAVTDNDKENVEVTQTVFSVLEKTNGKKKLKCFVLVYDRELKTILEETALFKCENNFIEDAVFNINEMGIKYGITMNIDKILSEKTPEILLVGLTEKTEIILLNLAHCITMQRDNFRFTIVEDSKNKIRVFEKKYTYLYDFTKIEFSNEIETEKQFSAIFICSDNQTNAIKQAVEIHYLIGEKAPNILFFCNETDTFTKVLNDELKKKRIFPVNLFEQIADYVFDLDKHIENMAKETHRFWNDKYQMNSEWDALSGHFKQSNRNQILDKYLKIYLARGKKFEDFKNCTASFSDNEKETLSIMEHRRWMLEKYGNGWVAGKRNNDFKRHDCLIHWNDLSEEQKSKDKDVIDLMIKLLNNQSK